MGVNAALVRRIYPARLLGRGVALNSVVVATAAVAGPSVSAVILSLGPWPWLFVLNLPLGLLVLWMGYGALPHNATARPQGVGLSWPDVLMNMLMFGLVFLGADMLGRRVGAAPTAGGLATGLALLAAGIAVGVVYLRRQWRLPVPMFPVDLLRIPVFRLSMCTSVGAFAAQMLAYVGLPFFLLDGLGRSPVEAGLLITAWPLGTVVAAPLAGRLIGRYPDGLLGGIGLGLFASGLGLLALLPAHPTGADIVWRMALCGMGFGLFQSPNNHTIVTSAPVHRSGGASGMLGTARLTGQTTGAVILAVIFSVADAHDGRGPTLALGLAALFACVAAGFSLRRLRHGAPGISE
jgi:DHA2 family multidrug resistance protein-like MFS transporter